MGNFAKVSAYVLHNTGYIVATTVPSQQNLLNQEEMQKWSQGTFWLGLEVIHHTLIGKRHAQVEFNAHFQDGANIEQKVGKIRKVLHFENEIEHKILVTYVIAKVSEYKITKVV